MHINAFPYITDMSGRALLSGSTHRDGTTMDTSLLPNHISITEFILRRSHGQDEKVAAVDSDTGERWTLGQLKRYIRSIGSALTRRGLQKGDVVVSIAPNCLENMAAMFAVPAVGGILSGMNPVYTTDEIGRQVRDAGARFIIADEQTLPRVLPAVCPTVKEIIVIGAAAGFTSLTELRGDNGSCFPRVTFDAGNDVAFLPFSSGTTGRAKGVMLTHRALMVHLVMFTQYNNFSFMAEGSTVASMFPFYHVGGLAFLAICLHTACTAVLIRKFDFRRFLQLIANYKVECLVVPPPVLVRMAKDALCDQYDCSSVRHVVTGAAPLGQAVQRELCHRFSLDSIRQSYGMTETAGATHLSPSNEQVVYGSAGKVHPAIKCKLMDTGSGREVTEVGARGEVWVLTPGVMKGYWNAPEKTREMLDSDGWLHTGDIGYHDRQGNLFIVDRLKELIKYKGFQVPPAELEDLLLSHPDVADVGVIGLADARAGEVPAAYVVLKHGSTTSAAALYQYAAERTAPYKHLRGGVHFRAAIPKNPSGKILRRQLRDVEIKDSKAKPKL